MYLTPIDCKCTKCGHEEKVSQHHNPNGLVLEGWLVVCPVCFRNMIEQFCGSMEPKKYQELGRGGYG